VTDGNRRTAKGRLRQRTERGIAHQRRDAAAHHRPVTRRRRSDLTGAASGRPKLIVGDLEQIARMCDITLLWLAP
jgi:hypothetical protein